jgi:glycosyltransferase involved in cell wall biosynthesis
MRFLILSQYFPPEIGAPQVRLANLIRSLKSLGHEAEVVAALPNYPYGKILDRYRGSFYQSEENDGVKVHRVWLFASKGAGFGRMINYASFAFTCTLGLARAQRPDYIFVESPPLFLILPAYLASIRWRVPIIFNVADLWPDSVRALGIISNRLVLKIAEMLERWSYRKARYVTAVTDGIHNTLINNKHVPKEKVLYLYNGVDIEMFKPRSPDFKLARELGLEEKKVIVYAGNLGYAQGLDVAVEALRIVQQEVQDVVLVFIGDGAEKERLQSLVKDQNISNILFLEPQPPEFIARLYTIASAGFVCLKKLPFLECARPSKIFPVMASGKPVIFSGAGEGANLIERANAGIVVPPEDPLALADAVRQMVNNENLFTDLGSNGRRYAENHLRWSILVQRWLKDLNDDRALI